MFNFVPFSNEYFEVLIMHSLSVVFLKSPVKLDLWLVSVTFTNFLLLQTFKNRKPTKPMPFKFAVGSKPVKADHAVIGAWKSVASAVSDFQTRTPERYEHYLNIDICFCIHVSHLLSTKYCWHVIYIALYYRKPTVKPEYNNLLLLRIYRLELLRLL